MDLQKGEDFDLEYLRDHSGAVVDLLLSASGVGAACLESSVLVGDCSHLVETWLLALSLEESVVVLVLDSNESSFSLLSDLYLDVELHELVLVVVEGSVVDVNGRHVHLHGRALLNEGAWSIQFQSVDV